MGTCWTGPGGRASGRWRNSLRGWPHSRQSQPWSAGCLRRGVTQPRRCSRADARAGSQPLLAAPPPGRPATVAPLAPQRYKVQFTARAETYAKLRLAQDLLRHQIPDGDLDQILSRALTALLEDLARQKCAATDRPREGRPTAPGSRHIPAEVKRAVWFRDAGRCVFVGASGRRRTATGFLGFH